MGRRKKWTGRHRRRQRDMTTSSSINHSCAAMEEMEKGMLLVFQQQAGQGQGQGTRKFRPEMYRYLKAYKEGVIWQLRLHENHWLRFLGLSDVPSWIYYYYYYYNNDYYSSFDRATDTVQVGGVALPRLTPPIFQRPYLQLPSYLTSAQRRVVHELASTELDLFHCSVDEVDLAGEDNVVPDVSSETARIDPTESTTKEEEEAEEEYSRNARRTVRISFYADGLEYESPIFAINAHQQPSFRIVPGYQFKPWFNNNISQQIQLRSKLQEQRLEQSQSTTTRDDDDNVGLAGDNRHINHDKTQAIQALIDQPSDCLRPHVDSLDFSALPDETLASLLGGRAVSTNDWMLVDTPAALQVCVNEVSTASVVAFDVEAYQHSKSCQLTCLLQLHAVSTVDTETACPMVGKEYVIDPLAPGMWNLMSLLKPMFEDRRIVKVGHDIGSLDVRCLHRDFGIWVVNAFDTYIAAQELQKIIEIIMPTRTRTISTPLEPFQSPQTTAKMGLGLTSICQWYGCPYVKRHKQLKSVYQRCDWRRRPLSPGMLEYARSDVRYLIGLRTLMMRDLTTDRTAALFDMRCMDQLRNESPIVLPHMEVAYEAATTAAAAATADENGTTADENGISEFMDDPMIHDEDTFKTTRQREVYSAGQSLRSVSITGYFTAASSISDDTVDRDEFNGQSQDVEEYTTDIVALSSSVVTTAEILRMQPHLMKVLTWSQERCLALWKPPLVEQHTPSDIDWNESDLCLFRNLVDWRLTVSQELGCHEDFVADQDFLAYLTLKKPTLALSLRRFKWDLANVVIDMESYQTQVLEIIRSLSVEKNAENDSDHGEGLFFYGNVLDQRLLQDRRRSTILTSLKAAACIGFGIAIALVTSRRGKHR